MAKILLVVCIFALLAVSAMGESAITKLKAKVESGAGAKPCDKAVPAGPAPPKQFLDIRLPVVVDDYHPPVGGFNPSHIPDKEVDVAARKILREIQAAEAEAKANGDAPAGKDENLTLTTEEHVALKQLLLDADILIRAAAKLNAENGPVSATRVAKQAIKQAAKLAKAATKSDKAQPHAAAGAAVQVGVSKAAVANPATAARSAVRLPQVGVSRAAVANPAAAARAPVAGK